MSRQTQTRTSAEPPQMMPAGMPGYAQAQQFYQNQLAPGQTSVYQGPRYAGEQELQRQGYESGLQNLGEGGPQGPAYRQQAAGELGTTLSGGWMEGPQQQRAIQSAAVPIFERFENQTMPGIRDRAQFSGQGASGNRRSVAETNAVQELGQSLATGVVAPIYQGERERMTRQAIEGSQGLVAQDLARISGMYDIGERERMLQELPINAQRDTFEEGLARQGAAAESLVAAATTGPGGSSSMYNPSTWRMILGSGKA